jgi:hypothetical protein
LLLDIGIESDLCGLAPPKSGLWYVCFSTDAKQAWSLIETDFCPKNVTRQASLEPAAKPTLQAQRDKFPVCPSLARNAPDHLRKPSTTGR